MAQADISMSSLMEQVLPFRSPKYLEDFCEKLLGEGISSPSDLLLASKEALETKLSSHASFNFIEMADALSLRAAMCNGKENNGKEDTRRRNSPERRGRSRSGDRRGRQRDWSGSRGRGGGGHNKGFRNNSRPHRNNFRPQNRNTRPRSSEQKPKPELWAAIEVGDTGAVAQLLAQGKDAEEKFEGWTPLMKAAEEGNVEVIRMLLQKKVDLEASNRKGRTALSFAAAPSFNARTGTERDTPVQALRLLLEHGADPKRKDERGNTPKQYAMRSKSMREDALGVFEEFGC